MNAWSGMAQAGSAPTRLLMRLQAFKDRSNLLSTVGATVLNLELKA